MSGRWDSATYAQLEESCSLSSAVLRDVFGGLLAIARAVVRSRTKAPLMTQDLISDLKMTPAQADLVVKVSKLGKTKRKRKKKKRLFFDGIGIWGHSA
jgi:hypothetical protein